MFSVVLFLWIYIKRHPAPFTCNKFISFLLDFLFYILRMLYTECDEACSPAGPAPLACSFTLS